MSQSTTPTRPLEGKVVVVTGGNSGIGEGIVREAAAQGAKVVIDWVGNEEATDRIVADVTAAGGQAIGFRADVSKVAELQALADAAVEAYGRIDVWVSNAGVEFHQTLETLTEDRYDLLMDINLKGAVFGAKVAAAQMEKQGDGGVIVNMSSINSGLANPNVATYAISKGGMNQVTSTAAVALAPHGIRVCGVGPGTIATDIIKGAFTERAGMHAILARTPMGRLGEPQEIAGVVAFLASDDASYITGETIYPDGGRRVLNYTVPVKE